MYQNNNIIMMKKQKIKGGEGREENERKNIPSSSPEPHTHNKHYTAELN
jgi:hypothetical protein